MVCGKLSFRPALVTMKKCLHEHAKEHGFISQLSELKVSFVWEKGEGRGGEGGEKGGGGGGGGGRRGRVKEEVGRGERRGRRRERRGEEEENEGRGGGEGEGRV